MRSLQTYSEHIGCVYQAIWNPNSPTLFGSCSADQTVKLWDSRQKGSLQTIHCHHQEVLTMDWNKYRKDEFVTGSVDQSLKVWDQRMPGKPLCELRGHGFAIRRLKCSPHNGYIVASASYDMTMRVWDLKLGKEIFVFEEHSEFVLGIDFSLFVPGRMVSCGWDELVCILSI